MERPPPIRVPGSAHPDSAEAEAALKKAQMLVEQGRPSYRTAKGLKRETDGEIESDIKEMLANIEKYTESAGKAWLDGMKAALGSRVASLESRGRGDAALIAKAKKHGGRRTRKTKQRRRRTLRRR
jgi:hypothetical protein